MYRGTALKLRPEALKANETNKRVITEFEHFGERFAWVFYPNGLQAILLLRKLPFVRIRIGIRSGALDDLVPGTLHALEHMLAKDVFEIGPHPAVRHLLPHGLGVNASTSYDQMSLYGKTAYRCWRGLLKGLFSMAFSPHTLDQRRWEQERPAIEQEIRSATEEVRVQSAIRAALHPHIRQLHPRPYGTLDSVAHLTIEDLQTRYTRDVALGNCFVSVQGVADLHMALRALEQVVDQTKPHTLSTEYVPRSPLGDEARLEDQVVWVRESPAAERVKLIARIPSTAPRSLIEAAFVLVKTHGNGGLLRDEFRRVQGWTYNQSMNLNAEFGGSYTLYVNARMKARHHERAKVAFQNLWREACLSLPNPQGRILTCFEGGRGSHALSSAERPLQRGANYAGMMDALWLEQHLPKRRPFTDIPPEEFPAIARHAPKLADLEWHMISVAQNT